MNLNYTNGVLDRLKDLGYNVFPDTKSIAWGGKILGRIYMDEFVPHPHTETGINKGLVETLEGRINAFD
jgi:hypothetical protein